MKHSLRDNIRGSLLAPEFQAAQGPDRLLLAHPCVSLVTTSLSLEQLTCRASVLEWGLGASFSGTTESRTGIAEMSLQLNKAMMDGPVEPAEPPDPRKKPLNPL